MDYDCAEPTRGQQIRLRKVATVEGTCVPQENRFCTPLSFAQLGSSERLLQSALVDVKSGDRSKRRTLYREFTAHILCCAPHSFSQLLRSSPDRTGRLHVS